MEVEPINIIINSDDELENDVEVEVNVCNPPEDNVNNSSAEVVYILGGENNGQVDPTLNPPLPPSYTPQQQQLSQEYLSSQDSAGSCYSQSSQLGYGWYPYNGSQATSLTQESAISLPSSGPLTQENPYNYYCSDQDDAMTVCESLTQDSVCSFSTMCSEATTIQDFSQDLSQPGLDLQTFTEADIGTQNYYDEARQAFYSDVTPTASEHNMSVVTYYPAVQNQNSATEMAYYVPQQTEYVESPQIPVEGMNSIAVPVSNNDETVNQYASVPHVPMTPEVSYTGQTNENQANLYPTNETTAFVGDAANTDQVPQDDMMLPVVDQPAFEMALETPGPALHLSEAGILSVLLRENIAVEMTLDRAIRIVDHKQNMVAAATSRGDMSCLYHEAVKISNQGGTCEADLFWNRRAKLCPEGIIFSCGPACYLLQPRHLVAIPHDFTDLTADLSVTMLFSSSTYGPHIIPILEEVVRQATYKFHSDGAGVTISVNGVRVEQKNTGDVFVEHERKYLHLSPSRQIMHVDTPFSELSVEKDWLIKVRHRGLSLICGQKGMTLSDGMSDCGFNPYRRAFLRPAYFNVQNIILDGVSVKEDYRRKMMYRRRNNPIPGRRSYYRRPEPDYSGPVQGLEQIIRREGEPDEVYYARLKEYRARIEGRPEPRSDLPDTRNEQTIAADEPKAENKGVCDATKEETAANDIGAAGDNIAHV